MSKIIYKGISYGSNGSESDTPHVALTQAEYDALSQSEKENGTIYFITDGASIGGIDYIIDQGISDNWTYRKWNSGIAECWTTYGKNVNASSMDVSTYLQFPFTFTERPVISISLLAGGAHYYDAWAENGSTDASQIRLALYNGYTSAVTVSAMIYTIGRWK